MKKLIAIVVAVTLLASLSSVVLAAVPTLIGGNPPIDRMYPDGWDHFYIVDMNVPFNFDGRATNWEIWADRTTPVQLYIYRNTGGTWSVVGSSGIVTPSLGHNSFTLSPAIQVRAGDYVGLYYPGWGGGSVSFDYYDYDYKLPSTVWVTAQYAADPTALHPGGYRVYSVKVTGDVLVGIDIKPGSYPNSICIKEQGRLPVAILGSSSLNVNDIDPSTIAVGTVALATRGSAKAPKQAYSFENVNGDAYMDLIAFFSVPELVSEGVITTGTTELTVKAGNGTEKVYGTDSVNVVP
jgi:hypothetical protein